MTAPDGALSAAAAAFLAHEADLIDNQRWDEWLALFEHDAVFWMPHRGPEGAVPESPDDAINLLYLESRAALGIRIQRSAGRDSVANTPLPRTSRVIGSVVASVRDDGTVAVNAAYIVCATNPARGVQQRCGRYEYILRRDAGAFRILRKKIIPLDEVFDGFIDVYLV